MLDMCTTVYTPIKTDKMSRSKLAQFEELLSVRDYPQILSRMVKLNLPYGQGSPGRAVSRRAAGLGNAWRFCQRTARKG